MLVFYVPMGYLTDRFFYNRALRKQQREQQAQQQRRRRLATTLGEHGRPHVHRRPGGRELLRVPRGTAPRGADRRPRRRGRPHPRRGRRARRGGRGDPAHPHPLRPHRRGGPGGGGDRRAGLVPEIEAPVLADINSWPRPASAPSRATRPTTPLKGGEKLELAGFDIDVIFTPGHSPGHVTFSIPDEQAIFSGDVLFQGSVGRVDLPGGDGPTLMESIRTWSRPCPRRRTSTPATWGSPRSARSGREPVPARARSLAAPRLSSRPMAEKFKAPRGTFDALPEQQPVRQRIEDTARRMLEAAGYGRIDTPAFEETELFERGVGESTDIVQKQMFSFEDQGGRSLTLRPEATAPICRAYLEHGMHTLPQPVKLWTIGPVLPPRAPAGRPLPPVQPGGRRGDRLRLPAGGRRADRPAQRPAGRARRRGRPAPPRQPRLAGGPRRLPGGAARVPARATRTSSRRRCGSGSTPTRCAPSTPTTRAPAR